MAIHLYFLSEKLDYDLGKINAYNVLFNYYNSLSKRDSSLFYLKAIEELSNKNGFKRGLAACYSNMGMYYMGLGDIDKAIEYYMKSLKISEKNGFFAIMGSTSMNISSLFVEKGDYKKAIEYARNAVTIYKSLNSPKELSNSMSSLGAAFLADGVLDSAEIYLKKSLNIAKEYKLNYMINTCLGNLAIIYGFREDYHLAIEISKQILEYNQTPERLSNTLGNIASYYGELKDFKNAYENAFKALEIADSNSLAYQKQFLLELLSEIYEADKKPEKSLEYFKAASVLKDSLFNEDNMRKLNEINVQYETEKKELKISELNREKEYQQFVKKILITGISALVIIIILIIYFYINKKKLAEKLAKTNQFLNDANVEISKQKEILEQKEIELTNTNKQLNQANDVLKETNEALEMLNQEKNEFLGIAAHDLKNPLGSISLAAYTIKNHADSLPKEKFYNIVENIEKTSKRMTDIITNLLDVNAIESGKLKINNTNFDFFDILNDISNSFKAQAEQKNINIINSIPKKKFNIDYDERILREIMENLISNAVKFSPSGKSVTIKAEIRENGDLIINVIDEGPGLSEDDMQKLFTKYAKLSARPTGGENSTGLGLSIVKKLANAMQSDVFCNSELGSGADFSLYIPNPRIRELLKNGKYSSN